LAVEQADTAIQLNAYNFESDKPVALVFGNEVDGVSDEVIAMCDTVIEIPQLGTKHSLNISVCAGVVIWEAAKPHMHD
jgi:23S rRNA (guanosine2251-2'-O)-methyltransferase